MIMDMTTSINKYGPSPLMTAKNGLSKIALAVKILHPNGGVMDPMAACSVTMIPK